MSRTHQYLNKEAPEIVNDSYLECLFHILIGLPLLFRDPFLFNNLTYLST